MQDSYFKRSVVLICEHNKDGTVGFILNRKLDITLNNVIDGIDSLNIPVYLGGPVQRDNLFFIHKLGNLLEGSIPVDEQFYWGGDFDTLLELIKRNEVNLQEIRFFIGYSGWSPGQLDEEISKKSWIITDTKNILFQEDDAEELWKKILKRMGKDYAPMANYPEDPSLN
jgi:putative transcriptional regulator